MSWHIGEDAAKLHGDSLVWDAHACLPLSPEVDIAALDRHHRAGVDFVSVNVGMDMNPVPDIIAVLAAFRAGLKAHADRFVAVDTFADVMAAKDSGRLAVAFDLEGACPLRERPEMVQLYYDLGVRQIHLAYNRNNAVGGGCHDADIPLSDLGGRIVDAINAAGMLMDCSHTGHRTSLDIMARSAAPVIYSHANPRALVDHGRNISDQQIDACAATGGVIGINGVSLFLGGPQAGADAMADHMAYVADRVGIDHVGIGLDYAYDLGIDDIPPGTDVGYWWPVAAGYTAGLDVHIAEPETLPRVTESLLKRGFGSEDVGKILGGNFRRVAERVWT